MTDMVRVKLENGAEASVPAGFAESHDLKPLAVDGKPVSAYSPTGLVLAPTYPDVVAEAVAEASKLKGEALNDALTEAGLPTSGSLADRQGRLADHQAAAIAAAPQAGAGGNPPAGTNDPAGDQPVGN